MTDRTPLKERAGLAGFVLALVGVTVLWRLVFAEQGATVQSPPSGVASLPVSLPSGAQMTPSGVVVAGGLPFVIAAASPDTHTITWVDLQQSEIWDGSAPDLVEGRPRDLLAARAGGRSLVFLGTVEDRWGVHVVDIGRASEPRLLAAAEAFIPAAQPDRLWVLIPKPSFEIGQAWAWVRGVAVDGRVTTDDVELPVDHEPIGSVRDGLVVHQPDGSLSVWDPVANRIVITVAGPTYVASDSDSVAWCPPECTELHVTDVRTGSEVLLHKPVGTIRFTGRGAFSPSGSQLAVPAQTAWNRAILSLCNVHGACAGVPGSGTDPLATGMDWSASGKWLFFQRRTAIFAYEQGSLWVVEAASLDRTFIDLAVLEAGPPSSWEMG